MPSNLVSWQALLDECATFVPELLPWASWCYRSHPLLWHSLRQLSSEAGVQQGDPLGPLFFALVLYKVVSAIDADDECLDLLFQAWFLDDGVLAGKKTSVLWAVSILEEFGPSLGIFINLSKCEVFSRNDPHSFPAAMKTSHLPHMVILGTPIGDYLFCANFIASKRLDAEKLLSKLVEVATIDPQVALILLRVCGSFCKLIHLARATPPSLVSDPLQLFDNDVRQCLKDCFVLDTSDSTWQQVQLSLRYGGLGLRSLSHHSSAALIASMTAWKLAPHSSAPHSTLIRLRTANNIHCLGIDSWYSMYEYKINARCTAVYVAMYRMQAACG